MERSEGERKKNKTITKRKKKTTTNATNGQSGSESDSDRYDLLYLSPSFPLWGPPWGQQQEIKKKKIIFEILKSLPSTKKQIQGQWIFRFYPSFPSNLQLQKLQTQLKKANKKIYKEVDWNLFQIGQNDQLLSFNATEIQTNQYVIESNTKLQKRDIIQVDARISVSVLDFPHDMMMEKPTLCRSGKFWLLQTKTQHIAIRETEKLVKQLIRQFDLTYEIRAVIGHHTNFDGKGLCYLVCYHGWPHLGIVCASDLNSGYLTDSQRQFIEKIPSKITGKTKNKGKNKQRESKSKSKLKKKKCKN